MTLERNDMKLSISNIAWDAKDDQFLLPLLPQHGVGALEIAPTRIIQELPYKHLDQARAFSDWLKVKTGMGICSMQSIWYRRKESIFGTQEEVDALIEYTKEAVLFAETIHCPNLVFGSPKNRIVPEGLNGDEAIPFFQEIGAFAESHGTVIALEAVPSSYGTNFLNRTCDLYRFVKKVNSPGIKMNLDCGTMIVNGEDVRDVEKYIEYIHHVHISENQLAGIEERPEHKILIQSLNRGGYDGAVSIEMRNQNDPDKVLRIVDYVGSIMARVCGGNSDE